MQCSRATSSKGASLENGAHLGGVWEGAVLGKNVKHGCRGVLCCVLRRIISSGDTLGFQVCGFGSFKLDTACATLLLSCASAKPQRDLPLSLTVCMVLYV